MPNTGGVTLVSDSSQISPGVVLSTDIGANEVKKVNMDTASVASDEIEDGSIVNADINAAAAIADTKLAQITTAGKVSGAALTSLASIPAGAGVIPAANLPSGGEYTYQEKLTFSNETATKTSTTFSARDEIMLVINLKNTVATARIDPVIRVNGVSAANYSYTLWTDAAFSSLSAQTSIKILGMVGDSLVRVRGHIFISGRHNGGTKGFAVSDIICEGGTTYNKLLRGQLDSDSNDVTTISVISAANMTGTVEIWVKTLN